MVTTDHGREVVVRSCPRSEAAGVRAGMTLAHARALLPLPPANAESDPDTLVQVEPSRRERDDTALRAFAEWMARRFSPIVAADPPDGLLIDLTGCDRLFRGERALVRRVLHHTARLGFAARGAVAPTIGAAWALARYAESEDFFLSVEASSLCERLAPLSVAGLRIESDIQLALAEVAIDRIGHLYDLPRASLPSRFGPDLLLRLDQALGRSLETIDPVRPVEPPRVERLFAGPTTQTEAITLTVRELLDELQRELLRRESGVERLTLELERSDLDPWRTTINLSRPSREPGHLWSLLRTRVETAPLGFGVEGITLVANRTGRIRHEQSASERLGDHQTRGRSRNRHWGEFVDTVVGRLGPDRVTRMEMIERHRPERSFRFAPWTTPARLHPPDRPPTTPAADRPSELFSRAEPIEVMAKTPDGPILQFRRRDEVVAIRHTIGPERLGGEWWRHAEEATRDYFKALDDRGRWWWLYREVETRRWFAHGVWT